MKRGSILLVYAHPDDESFGPGATVARYVREGWSVYLVCATRGERGSVGNPPVTTPERLGEVRERELRCARQVLGLKEVEFLGYIDGELRRVDFEKMTERILRVMERVRPDVVITFGPRGITGHEDHIAVHRATVRAFEVLRQRGEAPRCLFFNAAPPQRSAELGLTGPESTPNTVVPIGDYLSVKLEALRCHRTQVDAQEFARRLERERPSYEYFYRAWPPVPEGQVLTGLCEGDD